MPLSETWSCPQPDVFHRGKQLKHKRPWKSAFPLRATVGLRLTAIYKVCCLLRECLTFQLTLLLFSCSATKHVPTEDLGHMSEWLFRGLQSQYHGWTSIVWCAPDPEHRGYVYWKKYDRQTKHRGARAKKRIEPKHRVNAISLPDSQSVLPKNVGAGLLQPQLHLACAEIGHNRSGQAGIQVRQKAIVRVIVRAVVTFRPIVRTS